jgi:hypothetical protein
MQNQFHFRSLILLISLTGLLPMFSGCSRKAASPPSIVGTSATLVLPDSDPPVLSKSLADRIQTNMSQDDVLAILQQAAQNTSTAKSSVDAIATQGRLNDVRFDLTVMQGKRKLVLAFKDRKLAEKSQEGIE